MTVVTEVVIMTSFSKKHLNTLTTEQLSGQLFATLAMFLYVTIGTSLPFQKSILERLEIFNVTQNLCFGPT